MRLKSTATAASAATAVAVAPRTVAFIIVPTLSNFNQWGLSPGDTFPGIHYTLDSTHYDFYTALVLYCGVHLEIGKEIIQQYIKNAEELEILSVKDLNLIFKVFHKQPSSHLPRNDFLNVSSQRKISLIHQWCYKRDTCDITVDHSVYDKDEIDFTTD